MSFLRLRFGIGRATKAKCTLLILALTMVVGSCSDVRRAARGEYAPRVAGLLVVGTDLPAPGFWEGSDPSSIRGGFEWALADALAEELGLTLAVRDVPFSDITRGALGDSDLALAQVSPTPERRERVDFSIAYLTSAPAILTAAGAPDVRDLATAKEQRWVVEAGTTGAEYLTDVVDPDRAPLVVGGQLAAVQAVLAGTVDAALLDLPSALAIAHDERGLTVPARFDEAEDLAIVLPKGSGNTDTINRALRLLMADGTIDSLRERWLDPIFSADLETVPVIRVPR